MSTLKKRHWMDLAECASIVGLGVGSLASFLSTLSAQFLYTSAPLSFLVLLNLANRKRLEQLSEQKTAIALSEMNHKLTRHLVHLHEQVQALPTVETVSSLRRSLLTKNREVLENLTIALQELQQEINLRFEPIEAQNLRSIRPEVRQLREQHAHLYDSVAQISYQVQQLISSNKVEDMEGSIALIKRDLSQIQTQLQDLNSQTKPSLTSLQDQINQVNRQFQKLPPPVDATSLKQEVAELVKIVSELVPKRDVVALVSEVKQIAQHQESLQQSIGAIESAAVDFKRQLGKLPQPQPQPPATDTSSKASPASTANQAYLQTWIDSGLPALVGASTPDYLQVQSIAAAYLVQLRSQLSDVQQMTQTLAQHQRQLRAHVNQLPQTLDVVALQRQVQRLTEGMTSPQSTQSLQARIWEALHRDRRTNRSVQSADLPHYELIFDLNAEETGVAGSRAALEEAIDQTQQRLILVYPWSSQTVLDDALLQKLEAFLQADKRLEIGWCHQAEPQIDRFLSPINRSWADPHRSQAATQVQDTLNKLLWLKRTYPDRFHFKIMGTRENFLVSDHTFAVMGVQDTLTTKTVLADLHLKLRTTDRNVVQQLIRRFDNPTLDTTDLAAYWNRAVTRYDLSDKAGAIDDYTHVAMLCPTEAAVYNHRGLTRYDLGDLAGAVADFDQSIVLNPHQVAAYCNRGFIQAEAGDLLWAMLDYSLAIDNQPDAAIVYFQRGMVHQQLEDYVRAVDDWSEAIQFAPESAVSRYYRGIAYQKLQRDAEAIVDLETAAKLFVERGNKTNAVKAARALRRSQQAIQNSSLQATTPSQTDRCSSRVRA